MSVTASNRCPSASPNCLRSFGIVLGRRPSLRRNDERRMMTDQQTNYDQRAQEYEQKAKRVTDPWVRQRYLLLAKRYRDGGGPNLQRYEFRSSDERRCRG